MIIIIQHILIEGPETLGDYLRQRGFNLKTIKLYENNLFPNNFQDIEGVVCLGGPMNVDEDLKYSWLGQEIEFIQNVLSRKIPFLGLCLGSQLLAKACGAQVIKSQEKEIGFGVVSLTDEGRKDLLLEGLPEILNVYQWHEDMWCLPAEAQLLATGSGCPHQIFKVGHNAYGLQCHVEITAQSIRDWTDAYVSDAEERSKMKGQMLKEYETMQKEFNQQAFKLYDNFIKIMQLDVGG